MKFMLGMTLGLIIGCVVGAISHERDIYRQLRLTGNSNTAGWTVTIEAPGMKEIK